MAQSRAIILITQLTSEKSHNYACRVPIKTIKFDYAKLRTETIGKGYAYQRGRIRASTAADRSKR